MSGRFSDSERDTIRRALKKHMREYGLSTEKLVDAIFDVSDEIALDNDRRTLERFIKNEKRTNDATVAKYKYFIETLPEPDPIYDLGDAFADFFGLPEDFAERRDYMERMRERYTGRYSVWDISGPEVPQKPFAEIKLITEPHSAFIQAEEMYFNRFRTCDHEKEKLPAHSIRSGYDGICIPRETELFILMKEAGSDHEKVYILRQITADESENLHPGWTFIGNVMEKKMRVARDGTGNLADHYRVGLKREYYSDEMPEKYEEYEKRKNAEDALVKTYEPIYEICPETGELIECGEEEIVAEIEDKK